LSCVQHRRSIRFAKANRRQELMHGRLVPLPGHNQLQSFKSDTERSLDAAADLWSTAVVLETIRK
jgi:hypothetical protein